VDDRLPLNSSGIVAIYEERWEDDIDKGTRTVGYGDVTPKERSGRIIATFVMLQGIAFLAITTAVITSTFVARAAKERETAHAADEDEADVRIEARLKSIDQRLDRLEKMLEAREPGVG
jgi:voltage-gated potassium channel